MGMVLKCDLVNGAHVEAKRVHDSDVGLHSLGNVEGLGRPTILSSADRYSGRHS